MLQKVDDALLKSEILLDDEELFGPMRDVVIAESENESAEVVGELHTERNDELLRYTAYREE